MNESLRRRFMELKVTGQRCAIPWEEKTKKDKELISYLQCAIQEKMVADFEDIGFCYWNISDNFAMLRDGVSQYKNHTYFYEHIKKGESLYLYWLVCDATQKLTLELHGYCDFWWQLYTNAVKKNKDETRFPFVEFHTHRAAFCYPPQMNRNEKYFTLAKRNFIDFLEKIKGTNFHIFFETMFCSMVYDDSSFENKMLNNLDYFLQNLSYPKEQQAFLLGEWKSLITPFDKHKQAVVGIVSCVNALIDSGNYKVAKKIYNKARELGLQQNMYIEKRLY